MTDGHTRAAAGWDNVPVYWDSDEFDMKAYQVNVKWCREEGIHSPADLAGHVVPHRAYEELWRKLCMTAE